MLKGPALGLKRLAELCAGKVLCILVEERGVGQLSTRTSRHVSQHLRWAWEDALTWGGWETEARCIHQP